MFENRTIFFLNMQKILSIKLRLVQLFQVFVDPVTNVEYELYHTELFMLY